MYKVEILADSISNCNEKRLTSFLVTYPRVILPEVNTHKIISKNSESSRAVPPDKKAVQIISHPWNPIAYMKKNPGMQGGERLAEAEFQKVKKIVDEAVYAAVNAAIDLYSLDLSKQYANRFQETFGFVSTILTGTEWENFFTLRCSEYAQPEFDELAGLMLEAFVASTPRKLEDSEWHAPFTDQLCDREEVERLMADHYWGTVKEYMLPGCAIGPDFLFQTGRLLVSASRCGRLSYARHKGEFSLAADIEKGLEHLQNKHSSTMEHQGRAIWSAGFYVVDFEILQQQRLMWDGVHLWSANFCSWIQFRKLFKEEAFLKMDPEALLAAWRIRRKERGYHEQV